MPYYMSHIYTEPKRKLISYLRACPQISSGLYHLHDLSTNDAKDIAKNGLPEDGFIVIREVCDPTKTIDEARFHKKNNSPILSRWDFRDLQEVNVITRQHIPTLGFGKIYLNQEENPAPPVEFIRFLKQLSIIYKALIIFYHYYTAYEDSLADSEYAWVFGNQDYVYMRHVNKAYQIVQYVSERKFQIIDHKPNSIQPILHLVMQIFGVKLKPKPYERIYFSYIDWNKYGIKLVNKA